MIVGDPSRFAIESGITKAYDRPSFLALGWFVIHVDGKRYGILKPDATLLACSFDEVERRIESRGHHVAPIAQVDAAELALAFREAIYAEVPADCNFGVQRETFAKWFGRESSGVVWAPDGDEAFDDRSFVLQFDVDHRVRLIAFSCADSEIHPKPESLREVWLPADEFYGILHDWHMAFRKEWMNTPKAPEL